MAGALRRFRRFPLVTTWSGLMNVAGQYAPFFVFALLYTEQQTGWLAFTARVLALPVTVIGQAVAQVFIGRGANAQRGATGDLPRLTGLAVKRLAMVGVLPAVALAVLAPWAFELIFGSNWHRAGQYAQVMAVAFLAQFVAGPIANVFNLLERQGVALLSDSVRLVLVVAAPVVVWYLHGSDLLAVAAYAGVLTFSYLGVLALAWGVLRHA
jgi:O-antigen/teichoic acid export membrane protein